MNREQKKQAIVKAIAEFEVYKEKNPTSLTDIANKFEITKQAIMYYLSRYRDEIDRKKLSILKKK